MDSTFGEKITQLREDRGWRRDELAQKLGIEEEVLIGIEKGFLSVSDQELLRFAGVLEVDCDQLMDSEDLCFEQEDPVSEGEMRVSIPMNNIEKFREVLLYILDKVGEKANVGETVIYKLLYFIDFDFYEKYEEQLIGATYIKNNFGPTPSSDYETVINSMIENGEIIRSLESYYKKEQKRYIARRKPNLKCLSEREIALIDDVLARLSDKNATQMSEYSHGDIPWIVAEEMGIIDYESVFYRTPEYSVRNEEE
ncbi:type II toxin-antitoxin system antitoxin SocA domain-containing protein [Chlamydiifrater volucris]|uniref:type II toxin-antitoxin system antitoxin SocA domain-containing protein n=1 Tax=Chlamydiifrater volucris TaxID=2681470 RepID=UPI001BCD27A5|nr:type II toxin-antitoxin system antitoxin SocA domain-containing protein [Chlamydiifrater volucris]